MAAHRIAGFSKSLIRGGIDQSNARYKDLRLRYLDARCSVTCDGACVAQHLLGAPFEDLVQFSGVSGDES